ncbi:bZIP transcription factor [Dictyocaulus viviparus]|uniref:BZIP transcription factor n=1 Tax=Dictyocaulus viviparus TaxID=29172 RepID=A0A0D8XSZ3_DICVI|nr:bZIP transcription factor [Dictyocaulus viviparus]
MRANVAKTGRQQTPTFSRAMNTARLRNPPLYSVQHHSSQNEWLVPTREGYATRDCLLFRIVMDEQEKRKLDRKRARNRAAATKCRQKKIDRIQDLERMVANEKQRSQNLDMEMENLRSALHQLQQLIQMHEQRGISPPLPTKLTESVQDTIQDENSHIDINIS